MLTVMSKSQAFESEQFDVKRLAWERGSTELYLNTFALGLLTLLLAWLACS